jgi:hypothetical protein
MLDLSAYYRQIMGVFAANGDAVATLSRISRHKWTCRGSQYIFAERDFMPRKCQVCHHEDRWRIELLRAAGASLDSLAKKFGIEKVAIWRHWQNHVSAEAKASYLIGPADMERLAQKAAETGDSVLDYLKICRGALLAQLASMQVAGDSRNVAYVTGQLVRTLEVIAKISGELGTLAQSATYNITTNNVAVLSEHPAFAKLQATLLRALAPHPGARADVVAALRAMDENNAPIGAAAKTIEHLAPPMEGPGVAA